MSPVLRLAALLLITACGRRVEKTPANLPLTSDAAPLDAPDAPDARDASAGPAAAAQGRLRVPVQLHEVKGGTFRVAFVERQPAVAVRVAAAPLATLARDQRVEGGVIEPAEDDLRRAEPPFSQVGTYRDSTTRYVALVEARPQATVPEADDAPFVWWFAAKGAARPLATKLGKASSWRVWKGAAGHRQWTPDVLAIEDASGELLAARYLGAVARVDALSLDPGVPMFVVAELGSASGVDDAVTLRIVGYVQDELRSLLAIDAGPRSAGEHGVLGPPGSATETTEGGRRALRVLSIVKSDEEPCFPGTLPDPGCKGEERIEAWDAARRVFVRGATKPVLLRLKSPGARVEVTPR